MGNYYYDRWRSGKWLGLGSCIQLDRVCTAQTPWLEGWVWRKRAEIQFFSDCQACVSQCGAAPMHMWHFFLIHLLRWGTFPPLRKSSLLPGGSGPCLEGWPIFKLTVNGCVYQLLWAQISGVAGCCQMFLENSMPCSTFSVCLLSILLSCLSKSEPRTLLLLKAVPVAHTFHFLWITLIAWQLKSELVFSDFSCRSERNIYQLLQIYKDATEMPGD